MKKVKSRKQTTEDGRAYNSQISKVPQPSAETGMKVEQCRAQKQPSRCLACRVVQKDGVLEKDSND